MGLGKTIKKAVKSVTRSVSKAVGLTVGTVAKAVGLGGSTSSIDIPEVEATAPAIPEQANSETGATVKLGADALEDQLKRGGSRKTFTSLGGSFGGINL